MGKNKPARNSFYFFMCDFKKQSSIQFANMKEVADAAGPHWKELTAEQKKRYDIRAKAEKQRQVKYTSTGESIAEKQKEEDRLKAKVQEMKENIQQTVQGAIKGGHIAEQPFHVMHLNHYGFYSSSRHFIPAELAVARFTLKDGASSENVYHSIIKPGPLPLGYAFQALKISKETHQIEPTLGDDAESNLDQVRVEFISFMKKCRYQKCTIPPLYVHEKNKEAVEDMMKSFCLNSGYTEDVIQVYSLEYLFFVLRNSVGDASQPVYPSVAVSRLELEKDKYDFCKYIPCDFHAMSDVLNHCSRSHVIRTVYMICDNCCADLGIGLIAGQHVPLNSKIVRRPLTSISSLSFSMLKEEPNGRKPFQHNPKADDYFLSQQTESGMSIMSEMSNICSPAEDAAIGSYGYDSEYSQTDTEESKCPTEKLQSPGSPNPNGTDLHFIYSSSDESSRPAVNRRPSRLSAAFTNAISPLPMSSPSGSCTSNAVLMTGMAQLRLSSSPDACTSTNLIAVGRGRGRVTNATFAK